MEIGYLILFRVDFECVQWQRQIVTCGDNYKLVSDTPHEWILQRKVTFGIVSEANKRIQQAVGWWSSKGIHPEGKNMLPWS